MVSKTPPKDTKLVFLPEDLVEKLKEISIRKGTSITLYAAEAIEQALRMEQLNAPIHEAVDIYQQHLISRGSGAVQIPRSQLNELVSETYQMDKETLGVNWRQSGSWYGEYLRARMGEEALNYLRDSLQVSWNLDEVNIQSDGLTVQIHFTSFAYTEALTHLLVYYIDGVMESLGFQNVEKEYLRGLSSLKYSKKK